MQLGLLYSDYLKIKTLSKICAADHDTTKPFFVSVKKSVHTNTISNRRCVDSVYASC